MAAKRDPEAGVAESGAVDRLVSLGRQRPGANIPLIMGTAEREGLLKPGDRVATFGGVLLDPS